MGLGNGGLGRLAACYLDGTATLGIPAWGYTIHYQQGIFKQILNSKGEQVEVPDPWLENGSPWEVPRLDAAVEIKLRGEATRGENGKGGGTWTGGTDVLAIPYDIPVPGFRTTSTNNIRACAARGKVSFDLAAFNGASLGPAAVGRPSLGPAAIGQATALLPLVDELAKGGTEIPPLRL